MLQPLGNKVLVEPIIEEKKQGAILLVDKTNSQPVKYKVMAIGEDVKKVNVGDVVVLDTYGRSHVNLDGETYMLVLDEAIQAKVV